MRKERILTILINIFFILSTCSMVFATGGVNNANFGAGAAAGANNAAGNGGGVMIPPEVRETLETVTRILLLIGSAVCIGKCIHIGIKFLTASVVDKAQAKEAILPWIIGTIICFGAATIGGAVISLFTDSGTVPSDVLSY